MSGRVWEGSGPNPPAWLRAAFGEDVGEPRRLPWGFTNEAWLITVAGRRLVATRMTDPASAAAIVRRGAELPMRLALAGVPTPALVTDASEDVEGVVVTEFVDGIPGIEAMARPGGAALIGRLAGTAWRRLGDVDPAGLALDDLWSRPASLHAATRGRLAAVEAELSMAAVGRARELTHTIGSLLAGGAPGLVHGDLVPVNLLVRDDRLVALLDLEAARLGERLLDAAWFDWIITYHHPSARDDAWAAFAAAAQIDVHDERTAALLHALPVARILEILADQRITRPARARWLDQLESLLSAGPARR